MAHQNEQEFWNEVIAGIGDQYHPHSAEYGVFLFREKLRRRGFYQDETLKLNPAILARAVPWAWFVTIGNDEYLRLGFYGQSRDSQGLRREAFSCFDKHFSIFLGWVVPEGAETANEISLLTRISADRLGFVEAGVVDLHSAFKNSESGDVLRITAMGAIPISCESPAVAEVPAMALRLMKG